MKDRTQANTTNDESNHQAEALTDLPITDEHARQTSGGATARPMESLSLNFTKIEYK